MPRPATRLLSLLASISILLTALSGVPVAGAATCTPAPVLREVNRNQTLPYGGGLDLVTGKRTLVKLHLTLNECTTSLSGASVQVTGGELSVWTGTEVPIGGATNLTPIAQVPSGPVEACCTAAVNSPGDPKFVLKGPEVAVPGAAAFQATLQYTYKTSSTSNAVVGPPISFAFSGRFVATNPVRALVVPLGNARDPYRTWFPTSAEAVVQNAFQTVSRVLPVPTGICTPIQPASLASMCGTQYSIAPTLLDIGPDGLGLLRSDGTFCVDSTSFGEIKVALAEFAAAYNLANPSRAADVVTAYIDSSKSPNCGTQGMGAVGGIQSLFRGVADTSQRPSFSGGVLVQEIAHNRGVRGPATDSPTDAWHSPRSDADAGTQRAYNVTTLGYELNDRSVLNFASVGWHNHNVGLEEEDWACLVAAFGGTTTRCPAGSAPIPGGSAPAADEDPVLVISGRWDGTDGSFRTTIARAAESRGASMTNLDAVYVASGEDVASYPLAGSSEQTHGDDSGLEVYVVDDTLPAPDASIDTIEIREGDRLVWLVDTSTLPPSNVVAKVRPTRWGFRQLSSGAADEVDPVLSADDDLVAWVRHRNCDGDADTEGEIVVQRLADGQTATSPCFSPAPEDPDIRSDGAEIAFAQNGNVELVGFNKASMTFDDGSRTAYICAPAGAVCQAGSGAAGLPLQGPASGPVYAPDGKALAFSVRQVNGGELAVIDGVPVAGVVTPRRVTFTPGVDERDVTWSHTPEDGMMLAFERCDLFCETQPAEIAVVNARPDVPATATEGLGVEARDPSWGDGFIAAATDPDDGVERIMTIYPDDADENISISRRFVTGADIGHAAPARDPSLKTSLGPVAFTSGGDIWIAT
ncbi:MAG: hypothetical protein M3135_00005, partial [Actinomycetota bacterium]|nr:hypothetical protein [Actinomycetota bacterium]